MPLETNHGIWIVGFKKWAGFRFPVHDVDVIANAVRLHGKLHPPPGEERNPVLNRD